MNRRLSLMLAGAALLAGCALLPRGGGYYEDDGPPRGGQVDIDRIADAVPRSEPLAATGNKPYVVLGRQYIPVANARGYRERGVASWYGRKFQGHRTSSGEPYDPYAMTAAHRTLPLPSYARVTNLQNGRTVVVRINDRGPFRDNRLIDLSYVAAGKLGIVGTGTGLVEVTAVFADDAGRAVAAAARGDSPATDAHGRLFVQVGAFASRDNAEQLRQRLERANLHPVQIQASTEGATRLYRVRLGPLDSVEAGDRLIARLDGEGIRNPRLVVD